MIGPMMRCPVCGGEVIGIDGQLTEVTHVKGHHELTLSYGEILVCLNCPVISRVDAYGRLTDLGGLLVVADLVESTHIHSPQVQATAMHGRRES